MRTATLVANLLSAVIMAGTGVYVQAVFAEVLSPAGRLGIGLPGVACLLVYLVVWMKGRLKAPPPRVGPSGSAVWSEQ